jgi:hypothetical protein
MKLSLFKEINLKLKVMKTLINDVELYWISKNGGYSIDKRTWAGKDLVNRIKGMNIKEMQKTSYENGFCRPELVTLRFKDLKFLLKNLCEN